MSQPEYNKIRNKLISMAKGETLEIGFGTGLNLNFYPPYVTHLIAIDPNKGMHKRAQARIAHSDLKVTLLEEGGEKLPLPDQSLDTVVSTWTLCSIPNLCQALSEIFRTLKSDGCFLFAEHGISPEKNIQKWQNLLNPLQKWLGNGCHLNRNMETWISQSGFKFKRLEKFYIPKEVKAYGYTYFGVATKNKL